MIAPSVFLVSNGFDGYGDWLDVVLFSCGERIGSVSVLYVRMKLKHYIMKHDSTNYLYITPLQNQGLVLALLLRAQVCLYGFCD